MLCPDGDDNSVGKVTGVDKKDGNVMTGDHVAGDIVAGEILRRRMEPTNTQNVNGGFRSASGGLHPPYSFSWSLPAAMKRSGIPVGYSALSSFFVMFHSNDYIALFVPFIDIPVSLDNLFQRIASVNDRFYLPRLSEFFEVN